MSHLTMVIRINGDESEPVVLTEWELPTDPAERDRLLNRAAVTIAAFQIGQMKANIQGSINANGDTSFGKELIGQIEIYRTMLLEISSKSQDPIVRPSEVFRTGDRS